MVTLVVLDGFGLNDKKDGNAILLQGTPYLKKLDMYPYTTLEASGKAVGLMDGQMGNSEVGHLNLGAGRVVFQDLPLITNEIKNKKFFNNAALRKTIEHVKNNKSALHLMGLLSNGGVHSHIDHLKALVDMAHNSGVKNIFIHAFTDGRDTLINSGIKFVRELEGYIKGKARLVSLCGRIYAMDRENRWDRIQKAYDMLVNSNAEFKFNNAIEALEKSYQNKVYDEFIEPTILDGFSPIKSNDGVIFFNYRTDRTRELTAAISQSDFDKFERPYIDNLCFCCMTEYSSDFKNVLVAYPNEKIEDNLSAVVSKSGISQFHVTETTKYAHVTFFFNGQIEDAYHGEDRKLIDSFNVKDFAETPQMRAQEITQTAIEAIESKKYEFILINLSNPDMVGHTGNLNATIKAIEVVDKCAYDIAQAVLENGGHCIITADHGNAEEMVDDKGNVLTQHTTNEVPLWLVSTKYKNKKLKKGCLANVAPTILKIMGIKKPKSMINDLFE